MLDLVKFIINEFASKPEDIDYDVTENGNVTTITVTIDSSDMGKVIGRQGKIAKAIRTLIRARAQKENKKYNLEIIERGEKE